MSAILDALGYVGDSLDKPGRAVRGLLGGRPEEALAAIPFSDTMGLTNAENRVSGGDLLRQMGMDPGDGLGGTLAGMGVEMATDPLMFAGGAIGGMLGRRAGAAAMARGPRYGTTADDLLGQVDSFAKPWEREAAARQIGILSEASPQVFAEVPDGAKLLGVGAEGLALRNPTGDVTRLGLTSAGTPGRPIAETILQPTRTADYAAGTSGRMVGRAERVPMAGMVDNGNYWNGSPTVGAQDRLGQLFDDAAGEGVDFFDLGAKNAGRVGGRDVIIDPGAFDLTPAFKGGANPVTAARGSSPLMSALIALGGGDEAVRAAINAGRADPGMMMALARTGALGGSTLGAFGRLNQE